MAGKTHSVPGVNEQPDAAIYELAQQLRAIVRAISLEQELLVDFHVTACERPRGVHAERDLDLGVVHPGVDPVHLRITGVNRTDH
jgi:hypothetical protein